MAVNLKKAAKPVKADGEAQAKAAGTFRVSLGNGCQRFVAPNSQVYEAGKVYMVDAATRDALYGHRDEKDVRFFFPSEVLERNRQRRTPQSEDEATLQEMQESGELDTATSAGVTRLVDDDGEPVGVKGDSVSV